MNCIIIDGNKAARTAIRSMVEEVRFLNFKRECSDPVEALACLKKEETDLIFLDLEMLSMKGAELIIKLKKQPIIVLITSKEDYAVEAGELSVADYIIKPVTPDRFVSAVAKAKELFDSKKKKTANMDIEKDKDYIFVRSNSILTKIKLNDIIYMQALGNYVNIFTGTKRNTVHGTLKSMEDKLPASKFYRLHGSYLVGIEHVDHVEKNAAYLGKHALPIGKQFKKELLNKLNPGKCI